jgi:hypothetical protein
MQRSRVESNLSDFCFNNKLTRSRDRVESCFSYVIYRLRVDLEKDKNRLFEQYLILKILFHSTVFLLARDRFSISLTLYFVY